MLGFFPTPYPDETLYSLCARYSDRAGFSNRMSAAKQLFGGTGNAFLQFPNRLDYLVRHLPKPVLDVNGIIENHTLLPFFAAFLSTIRASEIRQEMRADKPSRASSRIAANLRQVDFPKFLRFCPPCAKDDRATFGEAYWHRVHQLAGILTCHKHGVFLSESHVTVAKQLGFLSAETQIDVRDASVIEEPQFHADHHSFLAKGAFWLLNNPGRSLDGSELRARYYNLLLAQGLAFANGRVRSADLVRTAASLFGDMLNTLGCPLVNLRRTWIDRLLDQSRSNRYFNPILHLLLMRLLGTQPEQFFTRFEPYSPFNPRPYPCLNPTCPHYLTAIIESCHVLNDRVSSKRLSRMVGLFSCPTCGFAYRRVGPDSQDSDSFRFDSVRDFGPVWEDKLRELWKDRDIPVLRIAEQLKTSSTHVTRGALRLGLDMNVANARKVGIYARDRKQRPSFNLRREDYRERWEAHRRTWVKATRSELKNSAYAVYQWLRKNDLAWLESQLPKPLIRKPPRRLGPNWKEADTELAKEIIDSRRRLEEVFPPRRISAAEIIRFVGKKEWLARRHPKLPKSRAALAATSESAEEFVIRKIRIFEDLYLAEKTAPTKGEFIARSKISRFTLSRSAIAQLEIDSALERINNRATLEK